jgi:hypothetical protein
MNNGSGLKFCNFITNVSHSVYSNQYVVVNYVFFKYCQQTNSKDAANFVTSGTLVNSCYGTEQQTNSFVSDSVMCIYKWFSLHDAI